MLWLRERRRSVWRYGFIYVDMDDKGNGTCRRSKKKSYDWMKQVIATQGACLWEE